jgi:hypothetical protein
MKKFIPRKNNHKGPHHRGAPTSTQRNLTNEALGGPKTSSSLVLSGSKFLPPQSPNTHQNLISTFRLLGSMFLGRAISPRQKWWQPILGI